MARSKAAQAAIDSALAAPQVNGQVGLGVDLVEISRMRKILQRTPSFAERVFSEEERAYCDKGADRAAHYATRFAAKEAVVKALGTGFACGIGVRDIEVVRANSGKPEVKLYGRAAEIAADLGIREIPISLSYTKNDAICCAIAITADSVAQVVKKQNSVEELTKRFKEVRGMLDEIGTDSASAKASPMGEQQ